MPFDSDDIGFDVIGQNNWVGPAAGGRVDMSGVVDDWFSEIHDYNYDRNRCSSGKTCTDYTQVSRTLMLVFVEHNKHLILKQASK